MEVGCPIYPVGIIGTDEIQPPGRQGAEAVQVVLDHDRPAGPARALPNRGEPHLAWRSMIDEVMFEIRELTGQEYRNHYAGEPSRRRRRARRRPAGVVTDPVERGRRARAGRAL